MRLNITKINETRSIKLGTVKEVREGTGSAAGNVVNVKLEGSVWNIAEEKEETQVLDIAFWNTDAVKMADRVKAAKVHEGSVITVDVTEKDGKYYGNGFRYKGHWQIPATDTSAERNVFMGVVASMRTGTASNGNKYTRISMPVDQKAGEEPIWVSITFWDDANSNMATRAAKCLGGRDGKKAKAVIVCGQTKDYEGRPSYSGYSFELI